LSIDFCIEGVGSLASLFLLIAVVDILAEGIQLLAQLVRSLRVVLA
jgi:hypothetical protein